MRILVTGSGGLVGSALAAQLSAAGHEVVGYDLAGGWDILDLPALRRAAAGCDAILHAAALMGEEDETPEQVMAVNVLGTWNVLSAGVEAGVRRVVFLSSAGALGVFKGERRPDYLPLDDAHPCYPATPYAISKRLGEEMCCFVSAAHGLPVICLRPPAVWDRDTYRLIQAERARRPAFEWQPYWEYGAFVDLRDLSRACERALVSEVEGYHCLLLASSDISTSGRTSCEWVQFLHPDVEWRGGAAYEADPYRGLIECASARALLGWHPRHTWRAFLEQST